MFGIMDPEEMPVILESENADAKKLYASNNEDLEN